MMMSGSWRRIVRSAFAERDVDLRVDLHLAEARVDHLDRDLRPW
jgi:hypothetical protein